ncbi:LytTR family transcriptional regulator DNA-binding domain-containing protein [Qipengyuania atrilutea]|uniref:LytTR family transcriptional regulator DNA-binding domain-containing protein n=1 Tax=Qipengyuania atrilutea TaxID=2744473 RepID=A0A850H3J4_9SPHN|nr:LytTR family transcriptional regulator DNA-binding domain-containing protein [Actirhodobacter atriluteus]NVD44772.1 LytTR family transcriptional regulator DNA-binding domain-containing protein [Actirhodobacter atriluteus]
MMTPQRVRVIICLSFDCRAEPAEVDSFKSTLLADPKVRHAVEVSGAYDFMAEAVLSSMSAYQDFVQSLSEPLAKLVTRHEESFICKRFVRHRVEDTAIWVPAPQGYKRVDTRDIDKVSAEGDYMRIYSRGDSWLVHATMRSLEHRLNPDHFIRLNRSVIVRLSFIDFFVHEGRRWLVQLCDGTCERVSRTHVAQVCSALRFTSSIRERASPKP